MNAVILNFLFIEEFWKTKCIMIPSKIQRSTTVFNIDKHIFTQYMHSQSVRSFCKFFAFVQILHKIVSILDAASSLYAWCTWFALWSDRSVMQEKVQRCKTEIMRLVLICSLWTLHIHATYERLWKKSHRLTLMDPNHLEHLRNMNAIA